jgi:Mn2+/Fe2+ NRAMP family transporter
METEPKQSRRVKVRAFFRGLGPGLITGAADDDPSGISTYATAGAAYGFGLLWTVLFTLPLMAAVQLMCARIGLVSGRGLASVIRRYYSRRVLWFACLLLVVANTVNITADGRNSGSSWIDRRAAIIAFTPFAGVMLLMLIFSYRALCSVQMALCCRICDHHRHTLIDQRCALNHLAARLNQQRLFNDIRRHSRPRSRRTFSSGRPHKR